ncbi:MAG: ferredoxin oxidoreductase [Acidilobaceae archaeon]
MQKVEVIGEVEQKRVILNSNYATAYAVRDADVDVIAVYPITPQTAVAEKLSEFIANGEMDAELIHVESEHSALSALVGAAATGARTFTSTSSQGLEYMHEILHIASGMRLPIVMAVATRALSAPINIWNDYSDLMNARDTSWITIIASSAQEVYDSIIEAYMISEDPRVLLPVAVAYDGFWMSHTYEPLYIPANREFVRKLLPKRLREVRLDPDRPLTFGSVGGPDYYAKVKAIQRRAMLESIEVIREADSRIAKAFGRVYAPLESYMLEDAEIVVVTYGGFYGTLKSAVDAMRKEGIRVGALRIRLWRPFQGELVARALSKASLVVVADRALSYGAALDSPLALEILAAIYAEGYTDIRLASFAVGIGGMPVTERDFEAITKLSLKLSRERKVVGTIVWGGDI